MTTTTTKPAAQRVLKALTTQPWALTEPALRQLIEIAGRLNNDPEAALERAVVRQQERAQRTPEAVQIQAGTPLDGRRNVEVRDGVAVIDLNGPIFRYANLFSAMSGASSIEQFALDFGGALRDPNVAAIVLVIDSPGGEVNGVNEMAKHIFAARSTKPVVAYVGHLAASAGYWLASAAREIVIDETAILGSIGVVATISNPDMDPSGDIEIVSSNAPKKRLDPNSDLGRSELQQQIDDLADVFVATVAQQRGVSVETVLKNYGQGGVFVGRRAITAGLADRVGTLEQVIAELNPSTSSTRPRAILNSRAHHQEALMSNQSTAQTDTPAPAALATDTATVPAAAVDAQVVDATPQAPASATDGLADLRAILATDTALAGLEPLAAVRKLMTEATDGRAYRADVVKQALSSGVRAVGASFDETRYTAMFARLDIESIQAMQADWDAMGDKQFPGGRVTVDGHTEPEQPVATVQEPNFVFAA